ncbi:secologanin synthase [Phtheirospermum japonicum]|uniref:Secologanin synthase n=1 Tax=Phtheirospermum japonicum TaxID=374723 RepID=A0A830BFS5_9LAMI|nr:secologanin synthase [Phtheirospermum japonicum]
MTAKGWGTYVIDVMHHLEIYTSSVLAQLMFGSMYTDKIKQTFFQLSELESLGKLATDVFTLPGQKYFPTKKNRRAHKIDKFVRDSFQSMIHKRLEKRKDEADIDGKNKDLLDLFMDELYDEKTTNGRDRRRLIEDVIGQCKIFFFAGFGSTSNMTCWTMVMLSVHKDWQDRARQEVMQVLGDKKEISADDLGQLKVIMMIVNKILRLYPRTMEFSRLVEEETEIGRYTVPKGTHLTCPILLLYRSTEIWGTTRRNLIPRGLRKEWQKQLVLADRPRICPSDEARGSALLRISSSLRSKCSWRCSCANSRLISLQLTGTHRTLIYHSPSVWCPCRANGTLAKLVSYVRVEIYIIIDE